MRGGPRGQGALSGDPWRSRTRRALWCAALAALLAPLAGCFDGAQPGDGPTPGNQPPTITDLSASPTTITVAETSIITATALDPDGDPLSYSWSSPSGFLTGGGVSVTYWPAPCCLGTWTITVTVSDGRGGSAQQSVNVTVQ